MGDRSVDYSGRPNPVLTSATGGFDPYIARQIAADYIKSLQQDGQPAPPDWVALSDDRSERGHWVTTSLLEQLLPATCFDARVAEGDAKVRMAAVLAKKGASFVARTGADGRFLDLIDREKIVALLAEREE